MLMQNTTWAKATDQELVAQLVKIIDSKVQYLTYEINELIYKNLAKGIPSKQKTWNNSATEWTDNDKNMLSYIEAYSKKNSLLLCLRKNVNTVNVNVVFNLLQEEKFMAYSFAQLSTLLIRKEEQVYANKQAA